MEVHCLFGGGKAKKYGHGMYDPDFGINGAFAGDGTVGGGSQRASVQRHAGSVAADDSAGDDDALERRDGNPQGHGRCGAAGAAVPEITPASLSGPDR